MNSAKVCHISSVHPWNDIRIFQKECTSLAKNGYDVTLLNLKSSSCTTADVKIIGLETQISSRFNRVQDVYLKVFPKAREIEADIYHLHDPELLLIALKIKRLGKIVIYDAHEDLPRQLQSKPYIPAFLRRIMSWAVEKFENRIASRLDGIITATPHIADRFRQVNKNTIDINNFPLKNEIDFIDLKQPKKKQVCYIGGITKIRGIHEVIQALEKIDVNLVLAGEPESGFMMKLNKLSAWPKVHYHGVVSREAALDIKLHSIAGLVTFYPVPNHINAQPNKIFEYMAAGLPVIGSNFSLWKEIIEGNNCGICVNPESPFEISNAIKYLLENPEIALQMGENGKKCVKEKYNWIQEEARLLSFYQQIILSN